MATYTGKSGQLWNDLSTNTTLAKDANAGVVQNVIKDGITVTLPAAAAGLVFIVQNGGDATSLPAGAGSNGTAAVTIAPNGTDTIGGGGRTSANSNLVNTKATSKVGDYVKLLGVAGAWTIVEIAGTWA